MAGDSKMAFWYWGVRAKLGILMSNPRSLAFYARYYLSEIGSKEFDVSIISLPKSGRTWLEEMILSAGKMKVGAYADASITSYRFLSLKHTDLPQIYFSHAGMQWETNVLSADQIKRLDPEHFVRKRALFLYRDPRDNLVSIYHHVRYRTGYKTFSPEDVITSQLVGLPKVINYMNIWADYVRRHPDSTMSLAYETLRNDPVGAMADVFRFIHLPMEEGEIIQVVEDCRFERMQERERSKQTDNPWLTPANVSDVRSFKARSGKVGEFRTLFTEEQIGRIEAMLRERLDPVFGYAT